MTTKVDYRNMDEFTELSKLFSEQILEKHREKIEKAMTAIKTVDETVGVKASVLADMKVKLLKQLITKIKILEKSYRLAPISDDNEMRIMKIKVVKSARKVYRGIGKPSNPNKLQWDEIIMTNRDYNVIQCLAANKDKVMMRDGLIAEAWENSWRSLRVVDVAISSINTSFECKNVIVSSNGGYMLNPLVDVEIMNDTSVTIGGITANTAVYVNKRTKQQVVIMDKVSVAGEDMFLATIKDSRAYIAITPHEFKETYEEFQGKAKGR